MPPNVPLAPLGKHAPLPRQAMVDQQARRQPFSGELTFQLANPFQLHFKPFSNFARVYTAIIFRHLGRGRMVGATGFEPATSCSQSKCSSQAELRSDYRKLLFQQAVAGATSISTVVAKAMHLRVVGTPTGPLQQLRDAPLPKGLSGTALAARERKGRREWVLGSTNMSNWKRQAVLSGMGRIA
jgi:hypothetical protein